MTIVMPLIAPMADAAAHPEAWTNELGDSRVPAPPDAPLSHPLN